MKRFSHLLPLFFLSALALAGPVTLLAAEVLLNVGALRSLSREDALKRLPARVTAVVTWRDFHGQLIVQDDTGGCWIYLEEARLEHLGGWDNATLKTIHPGHLLEIEGFSDPGSYAPGILPTAIRIVGERPLPRVHAMNPSRFFNGSEANLRVGVNGVVQSYRQAEAGWLFELDANPGRFTAEVPKSLVSDPARLVDAEVCLTGVAVTRVNTRGELTMPRVYCSPADSLVVERPAPAPFDAPLVPLDRLLPFSPEPTGPHRLRVTGIVTYALTGKFLYLQEGNSAVRVETGSLESFRAGDRVEASGFVDMTRYVGMLTEARVRKIGSAVAPAAVSINPEDVIALNTLAISSAKLAQPHDFDGHLIRFAASLLAVQSDPGSRHPGRRLTLKRGEMILSAFLAGNETAELDRLQPGSELEVTGIVQLEYNAVPAPRLSLVPNRLDVVLRSAADIKVLRSPSWWTVERLFGVVALVAGAFGATLVWVWQLRRQVRRKTEQLAVEMQARRDAAVEFQATLRERNRLAANLHDTLLQTLGAIGFQIGAGEAEAALPDRAGKPIVQLAVARRILDHAVQELRSSVWALRSAPLQGKSLPEALRVVVDREGEGKSARIELRLEGDFSRLSEFVSGNLVFAVQEALRNALKHGAPRTVVIEGGVTDKPASIFLTIRDDGLGFTPGSEAGANQGHFGLAGMRERIERLDGKMTLDSAPGRGATIRLEVPLRSYDRTVA